MSILDIFRGREPTNVKKNAPNSGNVLQMVTTYGENYYRWNGKLYESDIIRSCIRPTVKAVGKMEPKHIKEANEIEGMMVNPEPRIKLLLRKPNPYMTGQLFREKMTTQLLLNNNAFALIIRSTSGYPEAIYPIPCISCEAIYDDQATLYMRFTYQNGKQGTFAYDDIIHLRNDFNENDIFGESPINALKDVMECIGTIDQGLWKAIKNSNMVRWLLSFNGTTRPEDMKRQTEEFARNYLSIESDSVGVAATDQKAEATQIKPYDYVPNALVSDRIYDRVYSFFNTNKDIVQSSYNEDQWNSFYEMVVQPLSIQFSEVFTDRLFTWREQNFGNKIVFESANLVYASTKTKLGLTQFLDRGIMNANEIRAIFSLPAIPGGDVYVRRLDTAPTDTVRVDDDEKDKTEEETTTSGEDTAMDEQITENVGKGGIDDVKS